MASRDERAALHERWAGILEDFACSGLSGPRFCAERGLSYYQFGYHRKRSREASFEDPGAVGFKVLKPPAASGVRVRIGSAVLEIEAGFDPVLLRAVVSALA